MDLECIMLSKINQAEKDKYRMIHLYVESKITNQINKQDEKKSQIHTENKLMVARGLGEQVKR